ncbi:putative UPF0481 protein At3g02645 [Corylus avellana]|uniref:putative UPF0481 protein At3g02645 n=1 Tax=Corylus avellana TaxID=13451 RepID=UPI00286AF39F|nr:putative UPF0481 protein At3g02645 [Corylus avellana]
MASSASPQPTTTPSQTYSKFDEIRWVIQIRRALEEEPEDDEADAEAPVSIFNVPKALLASDPDSYTPQEVALGPFHCLRQELYEMERYKLAAAKTTQKQLQCLKFQNLVDQLIKHEPRIRACYHKYLDFNSETLAWMMAVDASFLLKFLGIYAIEEGKVLRKVSSRMSHLVDSGGAKSAHNAILRDMIMLENQIPLFVLRKVLELQFSSQEYADGVLLAMLMGLCNELSPLKLAEDVSKNIQVSKAAHLLDFLYDMIVPKMEEPSPPPIVIEIEGVDDRNEGMEGEKKSSADSSYVKQFLDEVWKLLSKLNRGPILLIKKVLVSGPIKLLVKLPWTILSKLPGFSLLKQPVEYFVSSQDKEEAKSENEASTSNKPPLVEEIAIPSVSELTRAGFHFAPTNGGVSTVSFDAKTLTVYLPTVSLDINTEVVLRNLVAYEALNASGPLVFTRYTELMNGIIDTEEDVKALRERGIILNRLKSDGEVASLWNGMSKSIRLTKVPFLDKVIEDVNKYHGYKWRVKVGKFLKTYVFGSWQFLTFLAAIFFLLLMTLQSLCSVYSCSRFLHINPTTLTNS